MDKTMQKIILLEDIEIEIIHHKRQGEKQFKKFDKASTNCGIIFSGQIYEVDKYICI